MGADPTIRLRRESRDTIQLENAVSTISQEYLLEFTSEYGIPEGLHPELPGPEDTIVDFPKGKVGVYTKFFEFANFRIPISQFLFDILGHYQIHLSQLSVIGAAKRVFPTVVDWRASAPKDGMPTAGSYSAADVTVLDTHQMDLFNLISAPNPTKVKTGTRPRAAHEVPLLTVTASRVIDMEDPAAATESSGTPSTIEKSPLDFANENPSQQITEGDGTGYQVRDEVSCEIPSEENPTTTGVVPELENEVAGIGPRVNKRRHKRASDEANANAPPKVLRKDYGVARPEQSTHGGKSLASIRLEAGTTCVTPATQEALSGAKSYFIVRSTSVIILINHLQREHRSSKETASKISSKHVATTEAQGQRLVEINTKISLLSVHGWVTRGYLPAKMGRDQQLPSGYPGRVPRHRKSHNTAGARLLKKATTKIAKRDQRIQAREEYIKKLKHETSSLRTVDKEVQGLRNQAMNLETLLEAEVDMKKAAKAKNAKLTKELESLRAQFTDLQVSNDQLSQQVSTLQAQVTGEERIKAAFEEFKKYEDERVNSRYAEMDARLDKLSVDFDEELYPHMLTTIAGRRWVIGHGLRLAVMKCAESSEIRRAFADVVSAGLAKGMSEGLKYGVEHGKTGRDLADIEAYDPEANSKLIKSLQDLKDLKYPMVDELEKLRDAPIELIMESLHLESDTEEDAPQWIRDLRPSTSQLKIPVYPEVRNPRDPWAIKEEILLEDAIAANVSCAEKKKKCRVVCRTHGVGSAHHARSNGVPVSAPTIAPQGLAILLADASTQTEISEGETSPRLLRSINGCTESMFLTRLC
ncbi:hypothetical protein Tco_0016877 [Tanacetum coccineum]